MKDIIICKHYNYSMLSKNININYIRSQKMKRKTVMMVGVLFSLMFCLSLSGCNKTSQDSQNVTTEDTNSQKKADDGVIRKDLTSVEVATLMGNGINLGNTMEAYGRADLGTKADVNAYETYWGAPTTTQEMVSAMAAEGFNTLRIPIAWTNMMDYENDDYTIDEAYLNRVEEIINYARNAGMYVIINDHWDGSWWGMFGDADLRVREKAMKIYTSMWTQIAERYQDYSDYLIFESANEELGYRLNDDWKSNNAEAPSGVLSTEECFAEVNRINQTFVDLVRGTGGNNAERFLLIAGYGTEISNTTNEKFIMPTDTAKEKLLISVHFYDPSGYCIQDSLPSWGSKQNYDDMTATLKKMADFTVNGYGVVIGEWGVLIEGETQLKKDSMKYYEYFLDNCDYFGFAPILWDAWSIFNREEGKIQYPEVTAIIKAHSLTEESKLSTNEIKAQAKADMKAAAESATEAPGARDDQAIAWLMYNSSDWNVMYCSDNKYDPTLKTDGIVTTDVEILGEGTYTVSLDFTQTANKNANSVVFSAIGIANGELLYPGYIIQIDEVLVNGVPYALTGIPYTTSDDQKCTRVNLYNAWVTEIPAEARTLDGDTSNISPTVLDPETLGLVENISVTFTYVAK